VAGTSLLLLLTLAPSAQDDEEFVPGTAREVDATPYVEALAERFMTCLAAEGTAIDDSDAAVVEDALATMVPLLSMEEASPCTATEEAMTACAASAATRSCPDLQTDILDVMAGRVSITEVPAWAASYASAMSTRIASCYGAETGVPLTADEQADLTLFESMIGQTFGALTQACDVREEKVSPCIAEAGALDCAALAAYLASEDVDLMIRDFMASCEGVFDCGGGWFSARSTTRITPRHERAGSAPPAAIGVAEPAFIRTKRRIPEVFDAP